MKNYKLRYRNAVKRWTNALDKYYKETGVLITSDTYTDIMFVKDPENEHYLIYDPHLPNYLTSADSHLEEADDDLIWFQQHHRNRKQRKQDYISRIAVLKTENLDKQTFQKEKRELWLTWMKK